MNLIEKDDRTATLTQCESWLHDSSDLNLFDSTSSKVHACTKYAPSGYTVVTLVQFDEIHPTYQKYKVRSPNRSSEVGETCESLGYIRAIVCDTHGFLNICPPTSAS
jgi:hypothetical protein